jgi:hypothetical protein
VDFTSVKVVPIWALEFEKASPLKFRGHNLENRFYLLGLQWQKDGQENKATDDMAALHLS